MRHPPLALWSVAAGWLKKPRAFAGLFTLALTLTLLLGACGNSEPALATGSEITTVLPGTASKAVCTTQPVGSALNADQLARMIQIRQKFFGADNINPMTGAVRADRVIASWISVSGYGFAINGHVMLLDAFVGNNTGSTYIPTDDCELSDLRPEYVFVGHGHYDHAEALATVVNRSRNALVVGTAELCTDLKTSLASLFVPSCIEAVPLAAPTSTQKDFGSSLIPGVRVLAMKHPHSTETAPENPTDPSLGAPVPPTPKPPGAGPCVSCPALTSPNAVVQNTSQDGAASLLYQFGLGDFVLTWNNTNGPNAAGDAVLTAMNKLPQTDVELGSILGFNVFTNGFVDARNIAEALRTRLLVPNHHDFIGPYEGRSYETTLNMEFAKTPAERRPGITFVSDPDDYLNHARLTWNPQAAVWKATTPVTEAMAKP